MLLFCSCLVPDTGFLLCFPWLISLVQKIQISSGGKKRTLKKKKIKLQVFYAKPCIWDKSRADTMDSAVWTDTQEGKPGEVGVVSAENSQGQVDKVSSY